MSDIEPCLLTTKDYTMLEVIARFLPRGTREEVKAPDELNSPPCSAAGQLAMGSAPRPEHQLSPEVGREHPIVGDV